MDRVTYSSCPPLLFYLNAEPWIANVITSIKTVNIYLAIYLSISMSGYAPLRPLVTVEVGGGGGAVDRFNKLRRGYDLRGRDIFIKSLHIAFMGILIW